MRRVYEIAQCYCGHTTGLELTAVGDYLLPVVVKLLSDCSGEVNRCLLTYTFSDLLLAG